LQWWKQHQDTETDGRRILSDWVGQSLCPQTTGKFTRCDRNVWLGFFSSSSSSSDFRFRLSH
jgi:hypothetical protein